MALTPGQRIEKIIQNLSNLPSLPFIATKIVEVVENKTSAANDIAEVIAIDQALTAKLLKLVNSSFFGFSQKITTVSRAVVVLGFQTVRTLALGVTVFKTASSISGPVKGLDMEKFWEHSIGVAAGSKLIASLVGYQQIEEAFLAGLLHDIGKIIFNQYLPDEFIRALDLARKKNIPLLLAEQEIIKADHEIAGEYLAGKWKLPYSMKKVLSSHHNPPFRDKNVDPEVLKLTCIVSLANTLCKIKNIGFSGNSIVSSKDEAVLQYLNIEESEIQKFLLQIDKELKSAKEFLGIISESETTGETQSSKEYASKPCILILHKDMQKILLSSLFIKSLSLDCQVELYQPERNSIKYINNLKAVYVAELSDTEIENVNQITKDRSSSIPVLSLPLPFDSNKILNDLGIKKTPLPGKEAKEIKAHDEKILITYTIKEEGETLIKPLEEDGYEILALNDPEQTMAKVKEFTPNLIILDVNLLELTAIPWVQMLKNYLNAFPETKDTKILIVSSGIDDFAIRKLQGVQIRYLLKKPFKPKELIQKVGSIFPPKQ